MFHRTLSLFVALLFATGCLADASDPSTDPLPDADEAAIDDEANRLPPADDDTDDDLVDEQLDDPTEDDQPPQDDDPVEDEDPVEDDTPVEDEEPIEDEDPTEDEDPADPVEGEDPIEGEDPTDPVDEDPVEEPIDEDPVEEPIDEDPVEEPIEEPTIEGDWEGVDGFDMDTVVSGASSEPPVADTCLGDLLIAVSADGALTGDGFCLLQTYANAWSYSLDAQATDGVVAGTLALTFNNIDFEVDVDGVLEDGAIELWFDDVLVYHASLGILIHIDGSLTALQ